MRLLRAALLKLVRRPASRISFGILVALLVVIYISLAASLDAITDPQQSEALAAIFTFPDAYGALGSLLMTFVILAAAAYAGAIAGGEWSWGAFRVAVARGESRTAYALVTFAAMALLILVAFVVLFVLGAAAGYVAGRATGMPTGDPAAPGVVALVPAIVLGGWWVVAMAAAIAFAVGFIARSAVMGIVALAGLYFGEQMAVLVVPLDVMRYAPITAGSELMGAIAESAPLADVLVPLSLVTAYAALALAALAVVARRAEAAR
jgi:hypothetical protein